MITPEEPGEPEEEKEEGAEGSGMSKETRRYFEEFLKKNRETLEELAKR